MDDDPNFKYFSDLVAAWREEFDKKDESIYRLAAQVMNQKSKSQWISVKDCLPEGVGFFIVSDGKNVGVAWKSYCHFEMMREHETFVTHWMPLPGPPEHSPGKIEKSEWRHVGCGGRLLVTTEAGVFQCDKCALVLQA
jgi:hypothetical protein